VNQTQDDVNTSFQCPEFYPRTNASRSFSSKFCDDLKNWCLSRMFTEPVFTCYQTHNASSMYIAQVKLWNNLVFSSNARPTSYSAIEMAAFNALSFLQRSVPPTSPGFSFPAVFSAREETRIPPPSVPVPTRYYHPVGSPMFPFGFPVSNRFSFPPEHSIRSNTSMVAPNIYSYQSLPFPHVPTASYRPSFGYGLPIGYQPTDPYSPLVVVRNQVASQASASPKPVSSQYVISDHPPTSADHNFNNGTQ